ncbi:hypothetical protein DIE14_02380 [Burkholderia sp. Bp9017]|uniref:hypothetical protein n=1 Tax=unclassified Burkholderia TaxID=2613784 RepID=UPI000F5ECFB1|nr:MULTISPECIES: hypothetical protein [unclassified Burkholderia]RQZ31772.1 hypothetical protein DIE14_02380 [Burkholderia sp. Bp9017]RQZ37904.1 hypothetical protein DIE13_02370 [Burkholderia sp. Bp9016]
MARAPRDWKDVRLFNLQINYDADPDVATFVYKYKDGSLSKLIKMLIRQHMTTTGDPAVSLEFCRRTRTNALLDSIHRDDGLDLAGSDNESSFDVAQAYHEGKIVNKPAEGNEPAEVRRPTSYSGPNAKLIREFDSI